MMGVASASTWQTSAVRLRERLVLTTGRASMSSGKIFFSKRSLRKAGLRAAAAAGAGALGEDLDLNLEEVAVDVLKSLLDPLGAVRGLERVGRRPAEHLLARVRRQLAAEAPEARDLVALGDDDVDGEAHPQNLLRLPELAVERRGLLLDARAAVEAAGRDE